MSNRLPKDEYYLKVNGDATIMQPKSLIQIKMKQLFDTGVIVNSFDERHIIYAMLAAGCIGIVSDRAVI